MPPALRRFLDPLGPAFLLISLVFQTPTLRAEEALKKEAPIHLSAEHLQYLKKEDVYIAEGRVSLEQGDQHLKADRIHLHGETGDVEAFGHIYYLDGKQEVEADRLELNISTKLGILYNGKLLIKGEDYHLEGQRIVRRSADQYTLFRTSFTACDCEDDPAWRFRAKELDLTLDEYLFAKQIFFYANEVPVFYLPYFVYPVKSGRQTGLLVPKPGYSSRYGFRYRQDFFWAINRSQDATVSLEHRGRKGKGLGLEYRYVPSKAARGILESRYFQDREASLDRWEIRYHHAQRFSKRTRARLDLRYVNENDNFRDLSDQTSTRALQNIESNFFLTYEGEASFAYLLARYTQDLSSQSNDSTPQRLPELGYNLIDYRLSKSPLRLNIESTAVHFGSEGGLSLQRIDLYPKLSLPLPLWEAANLTPWIGYRETWYRDEAGPGTSSRRGITPFGLRLESDFSKSWAKATHVISPSIRYESIMVSGEQNILAIDEVDRLHSRESITFSLMQRIIRANDSGEREEKASLRLTESYDFGDFYSGSSDEVAADEHRFSDLRGQLRLRPWQSISISLDSFYNHHDHEVSSWNTDLEARLKPFLTLVLGQRRTRAGSTPIKGDLFNPLYLGQREAVKDDLSFLSEHIVIDTPWGIRFENRAYFDQEEKELVEIDYILQYQAQCWGIGMNYLDFPDRKEFSFVVTLKGLGGFSPPK